MPLSNQGTRCTTSAQTPYLSEGIKGTRVLALLQRALDLQVRCKQASKPASARDVEASSRQPQALGRALTEKPYLQSSLDDVEWRPTRGAHETSHGASY